jgi:alkanesulfonate monooxygenase SsuD/methylene tetrahydromethanopterin reductase-like flavin-dependent oxidoreductase (luciferase family)
MVPRRQARPRYEKFLVDWNNYGHGRKPNIAYSTVVYVDETDRKALDTALFRASRAYEGLLPMRTPGESFESRLGNQIELFASRGEHEAGKLVSNIFDPDYIMGHDLVFVGSPETVTTKLRKAAEEGFFNTFMGEFNFADLPEPDLMRSIRMFGEKVMPALRDYEPF